MLTACHCVKEAFEAPAQDIQSVLRALTTRSPVMLFMKGNPLYLCVLVVWRM
jgi:hypothetical protein